MNAAFADSYFYLALLNGRDAGHERAKSAANDFLGEIVTTQWILLEVADAFCRPSDRPKFAQLRATLSASPQVIVVPADPVTFELGVELYLSRQDKDWPLTDCISFLVMQQRGLTAALTADSHFEQAGFVALLRDR